MATDDDAPATQGREGLWVTLGAAAGVLVAGLIVALLVLKTNGSGDGRPAGSPTDTAQSAADKRVSARDDAQEAAENAATVLVTSDYHLPGQSVDQWVSVAVAPLLDAVKEHRSASQESIAGSKATTTGKVLTSAVAQLAGNNETADVLVVLEVDTLTGATTTPTIKHLREKLTMTHTPDGWKVSAVADLSQS